jgi:hypothetical protein
LGYFSGLSAELSGIQKKILEKFPNLQINKMLQWQFALLQVNWWTGTALAV